jgi:hypothetical protein
MAKMTYKMELAQGITLTKVTIQNKEILLTQDQVSATLYQSTIGYNIYPTDGEVNVFVEASGITGLEWSLEIKIGGEKLREDPIKKSVGVNGKANLNENYPW